jgi:hypothetical protein
MERIMDRLDTSHRAYSDFFSAALHNRHPTPQDSLISDGFSINHVNCSPVQGCAQEHFFENLVLLRKNVQRAQLNIFFGSCRCRWAARVSLGSNASQAGCSPPACWVDDEALPPPPSARPSGASPPLGCSARTGGALPPLGCFDDDEAGAFPPAWVADDAELPPLGCFDDDEAGAFPPAWVADDAELPSLALVSLSRRRRPPI